MLLFVFYVMTLLNDFFYLKIVLMLKYNLIFVICKIGSTKWFLTFSCFSILTCFILKVKLMVGNNLLFCCSFKIKNLLTVMWHEPNFLQTHFFFFFLQTHFCTNGLSCLPTNKLFISIERNPFEKSSPIVFK